MKLKYNLHIYLDGMKYKYHNNPHNNYDKDYSFLFKKNIYWNLFKYEKRLYHICG